MPSLGEESLLMTTAIVRISTSHHLDRNGEIIRRLNLITAAMPTGIGIETGIELRNTERGTRMNTDQMDSNEVIVLRLDITTTKGTEGDTKAIITIIGLQALTAGDR